MMDRKFREHEEDQYIALLDGEDKHTRHITLFGNKPMEVFLAIFITGIIVSLKKKFLVVKIWMDGNGTEI